MKNGSDSDDLRPPDELIQLEGIPGYGKDIPSAFADAWEKGKPTGHRVFRVQEIFVWGDNPISGYRVTITPGP